MKTPLLNHYYLLVGFENAGPINAKFTFTDLSLNQGIHKDSEMFYSLQEQPEIFDKIEMYKPIVVNINRDDNDYQALLIRIPYSRYEKTNI